MDLMDSSTLVHKVEFLNLNGDRSVNSCKQLCDLPDAILLQILSLLPTEDVVRTSVLSRRWEYLWTSIPSLVFREEYKENHRGRILFRNFVERALLLRGLSPMKVFSLSCVVDSEEYFNGNESRVNTWITAAIGHNVQDLCLYLEFGHPCTAYKIPRCIFRCGTLRELHLQMKHDLKLPSIICLPNLKVLILVDVPFGDDKSLEKLLSCPSLEKLSLENCKWDLEVLEISAPNLLHLNIVEYSSFSDIGSCQVRIHGTFIKSFDYYGDLHYDDVVLTSPSSLVEASIQVHQPFSQVTDHLCNFMKCLSNVKQLAFSIRSLEDMVEGEEILNSFPVFHSLTELELTDPDVRLESRALLLLLSKCPILRSLRFSGGVYTDSKRNDRILDPKPTCFTASLKEIKINCFNKTGCEMLAVRNLVIAAQVLDKVLFSYSPGPRKWQGRLMQSSSKLPGAPDQCTISSECEHWDYFCDCSQRLQFG
ncbi:hypothetical protein EUGRSUZ_E04094 [Eucalyptus grandis]|uniref:F-box domain-containing protein n=2 Tax=Eucalyptus grandis TaxID=71139 RepID=A0A059CA68_EUCGR|nr:hypothetical protein EUGRSUZ_E04094 [Eucalyptus grandis]